MTPKLTVAAATMIALTALAQVQLPRVDDIIEVSITNLDVVVTDDRGKHVTGLTAADFELYEDGQRQEVTNFTEYRLGSSAETSVDFESRPETSPDFSAGSKSSAAGSVGGSRSETSPLSEAESRSEAPAALAPGSTSDTPARAAPSISLKTSVPPPRRIVIFFDVATTTTFERKRAASALTEFVGGLRSDDEVMVVSWNRNLKIVAPLGSGREAVNAAIIKASRELGTNSLNLLTQDLQRVPAAERAALARRHARQAAIDLQMAATGVNAVITRLAGLEGRKILFLVTKGFAGRLQEESEELADEDVQGAQVLERIERNANAAGVTLYGIHGGGVESGVSVEDSVDLSNTRMRTSASSIDGLRHLAGKTGGSVVANSNDFRAGLTRVSADLSNYYSLGYRTRTRRVRGEKRIEVRMRDGRLRARARRALIERTLDEEIGERLVTHLFFPVSGNDLNIAADGKAQRTKKSRYAVAVDIRVPYAVLAFTPDGDHLVADLSFYIGSADARGSVSEVKRFDKQVRVPRGDVAKLASQSYIYGFDVDLRTVAGEHRVAVAVLDKVSRGIGYAAVDLGKLASRRQ